MIEQKPSNKAYMIQPYTGDEPTDLGPRKIEIEAFRTWFNVLLSDPAQPEDQRPSIGIEWTPDKGWAIRTYADNDEPSHTIYLRNGKATLQVE
jgi:hypothetical protein